MHLGNMRISTFGLVAFSFSLLACALQCRGQGTRDTYDFVIVGAGSAGCVVAGELAIACRSCSILLIEAGGDATDPEVHNTLQQTALSTSPVYSYLRDDQQTTPATFYHDRTIHVARGKMLGGSGGVNAMYHVVGNPHTWDTTATEIGDSKWSWFNTAHFRDDVVRDFHIFSDLHNSSGKAELFVSAAESIGYRYDLNTKDGVNGFTPAPQIGRLNPFRPGGIRQTSCDAKIFHGKHHVDNVEILTFHRVATILVDPDKVATGVRVVNLRSGLSYTFGASREVILSAGTFRTPQVLLLSGIGPRDYLSSLNISVVQDLPAVGLNLNDHLNIQTAWELLNADEYTTPFLYKAPSFQLFGPEPSGQPSFQFEVGTGFVSVNPLTLTLGGSLRLNTTDPIDNPVVYYNITREWEDAILSGVKTILFPLIAALRAHHVFGLNLTQVDPTASDDTIRQYIRQAISTNYHPTGTARVGRNDDPTAVVDSHFRVRGVQHLRVVDASVFRLQPVGNINSQTLALAFFASDVIAADNNLTRT